ncbi:MAG: hypothetical protein WCP14_02945 [bacterium]
MREPSTRKNKFNKLHKIVILLIVLTVLFFVGFGINNYYIAQNELKIKTAETKNAELAKSPPKNDCLWVGCNNFF